MLYIKVSLCYLNLPNGVDCSDIVEEILFRKFKNALL